MDQPNTDNVGLGRSIGHGVAWSALNAGVLRLGQFLMSIVIARLVSPNEFGVFVVALTIFAIVVNVSDVGVGSALLREVGRTREIAPTVATIAIGASTLLGVAMVLGAPWLARGLGAEAATPAVRLMALTVIIGGAGAVPGALLLRDYKQKRRFAVDASCFVVSNVVLVVLALGGLGVMALAWSRVIGQLMSTVMLTLLAPERYWPRFEPREARKLFRFGLPLAGANLLGFTIGNIDFIVLGRLRGATPLGHYNQAWNISSWPVSIFTAILNNVTLTTLARVRESKDQSETHLSAATSALAAASFPVSALCVALAEPLIVTVYGERWAPAAAALVVLAAFGSIRVVLSLLSDLLVALGLTRSLLSLQVLWIAALLPAMIFGVHRWGIAGAGLAHTAVAIAVVLPTYFVVVNRYARLRLGWLIRSVTPPLAASIVCWVAARVTADQFSSPLLAFFAGVVAGTLGYLVVIAPWLRKTVKGLRKLYGRTRATSEFEQDDSTLIGQAPDETLFR